MKSVNIDSKLGEIFLLPVPGKTKCHYFVIMATLQDDKNCLLASFCSVKTDDFHKEKEYDKSCIIDEEDNICFSSGNPLIKHKSYIEYGRTIEMNYSDIKRLQKNKEVMYCTTLDEDLLNRIINGAKKSPYMSERIKNKYFNTDEVDNNKVIIIPKTTLQFQR